MSESSLVASNLCRLACIDHNQRQGLTSPPPPASCLPLPTTAILPRAYPRSAYQYPTSLLQLHESPQSAALLYETSLCDIWPKHASIRNHSPNLSQVSTPLINPYFPVSRVYHDLHRVPIGLGNRAGPGLDAPAGPSPKKGQPVLEVCGFKPDTWLRSERRAMSIAALRLKARQHAADMDSIDQRRQFADSYLNGRFVVTAIPE